MLPVFLFISITLISIFRPRFLEITIGRTMALLFRTIELSNFDKLNRVMQIIDICSDIVAYKGVIKVRNRPNMSKIGVKTRNHVFSALGHWSPETSINGL